MPQKQNMMIHITQQKNKTKILSEQDEPLFAMSLPPPRGPFTLQNYYFVVFFWAFKYREQFSHLKGK